MSKEAWKGGISYYTLAKRVLIIMSNLLQKAKTWFLSPTAQPCQLPLICSSLKKYGINAQILMCSYFHSLERVETSKQLGNWICCLCSWKMPALDQRKAGKWITNPSCLLEITIRYPKLSFTQRKMESQTPQKRMDSKETPAELKKNVIPQCHLCP